MLNLNIFLPLLVLLIIFVKQLCIIFKYFIIIFKNCYYNKYVLRMYYRSYKKSKIRTAIMNMQYLNTKQLYIFYGNNAWFISKLERT